VPINIKSFFYTEEYLGRWYLVCIFMVTCSARLVSSSVVLWRARKPYWLARIKSFLPTFLWTVFKRDFWNNSPVVYRRLMVHEFWGHFESLFRSSKDYFWFLPRLIGASGIRLECRQFHRPCLVSVCLSASGQIFNCCFEQSLNCFGFP